MDSSPSTTDVSLLGRIQHSDQDEQAWREFVDRYGKRILLWCENRGLQRNDAEEVTQQVLIRICRYVRKFQYDETLSFRAYLRRATENAITDFQQEYSGREQAVGGSVIMQRMLELESREELVQRLEKAFDIDLLEMAMSRIRSRVNNVRWSAWYLTKIKNQDHREVADDLGINIATLYAAKNQVGKMVRDEIQFLENPDRPPKEQ